MCFSSLEAQSYLRTMEFVLDRSMSFHRSEADLVLQIAAGDEDALQQLYTAYGQRLYAFALRLTNDPATADDVLQESLVAIWQGAGRFRGQGRVIAWLLSIVHHQALNAIRSQRRRMNEAGEEEFDRASSEDPAPDERLLGLECRRVLKDGLGRLSLEHRTVLELVFYQDLSLEEAALVCSCPVGTVKSRLNHAKSSLRGTLLLAGVSAEDIK
jgi:RNA polymerase sigma-70 factor (ECF subfamily)